MLKFLSPFAFLVASSAAQVGPLHLEQLGQKEVASDFYGATAPLYSEKGQFEDLYKLEWVRASILEGTAFELENFMELLPREGLCPNHKFEQHQDYLRYLFRLVAISYLYEAMNESFQILKSSSLKNREKSCSTDFQDLFAQCSPQGIEMKKFLRRLERRFLSQKEKNIFEGASLLSGQTVDFPQIKQLLEKGSIAARKIEFDLKLPVGREAVISYLEKNCQQNNLLIQQICSEEDSLYGLSAVPEAIGLVARSNALAVINREGEGLGCLKRFVEHFSNKEKVDLELKRLFPVVLEKVNHLSGPYEQGSIFVSGALKQFDDRGLIDFLFSPLPKKPVPQAAAEIVKAPAVAPLKVTTSAPKPDTSTVVKPLEKKENKISYFEASRKKFLNEKMHILSLDMESFYQDYIFGEERFQKLKGPLENFQTRKAISDMKEWDGLGTEKAPVPLIFLKFLIDHDFHQGLFNLTGIVGEKFFVKNDIDKTDGVAAIALRNDKSTGHQWQIDLITPESAEASLRPVQKEQKPSRDQKSKK